MPIRFEYIRGTGPGGQHRNKTASCVRATDEATGISVTIDGRNQHANKRKAIKELERRIKGVDLRKRADARKARRDVAIHDHTVIRTYHFGRNEVVDARSGKRAPLKEVLYKGRLDLVR